MDAVSDKSTEVISEARTDDTLRSHRETILYARERATTGSVNQYYKPQMEASKPKPRTRSERRPGARVMNAPVAGRLRGGPKRQTAKRAHPAHHFNAAACDADS